MNKYAAIALLLAGCGTTPMDILQSGEKFVRTYDQPPATAAACMARHMKNFSLGITADVLAMQRPNEHEVVVRAPLPGTTFAVAHFEPHGSGSRATVYFTSNWLVDRASFQEALLQGCMSEKI